jgi:hypothetical protein
MRTNAVAPTQTMTKASPLKTGRTPPPFALTARMIVPVRRTRAALA